MKIQSLFASVRSFRILCLALPTAALLCAAPLTRSAQAQSTAQHLYLFDDVFGVTDVTSTFDGSSVISVTGEIISVRVITMSNDASIITGAGGHTTDIITGAGGHTTDIITGAGGHTTDIITGAGGHTTDIITGAGGHTTDIITGAGGHTTDFVINDANELIGVVAP